MAIKLMETKKEYSATHVIDEAAGGGELIGVLKETDGGNLFVVHVNKEDANGMHVLKNQPVVYVYMGADVAAAKTAAEVIFNAVVAGWSMTDE